MRMLVPYALSLALALGAAGGALAHPLSPDVEPIGARLQYCAFDLFRAQQPDGTYLAEVADDLLLHFFTGILDQSLRRALPAEAGRLEPRSDPARRLLADVVAVAYSHDVPVRLRRDATGSAYFDLLRAVWPSELLMRVMGARRVRTRHGLYDGDVFGAAVLASAAVDLHDRVAWGPQRIVNVIEDTHDPASWSLDGVPLTAPQFQSLIADLAAGIDGWNAEQKIDLVGGHCLHFHPHDPGVSSISAADGDGEEEQQATFYDVIDVVAKLPKLFLPPSLNLGEGPRDGDGGGGGQYEVNHENDSPQENGEDEDDFFDPPSCVDGTVSSCQSGCSTVADCHTCCDRKADIGILGCGHLETAQSEFDEHSPGVGFPSPDGGLICRAWNRLVKKLVCKRLCSAP